MIYAGSRFGVAFPSKFARTVIASQPVSADPAICAAIQLGELAFINVFASVLRILQVRITMEAFGTVADVAWSIERVEALSVVAEARVGPRLLAGYVARLVPDGPIHDERRLAAVVVNERRRGRIGRREGEAGRVHEHRVAAAADVVDLGRVEARVELHVVVLQPLGDGGLAAPYPGAGAVAQGRPHIVSPAHGHTPAHVLVAAIAVVASIVYDVRQRLATDDRELVGGVGEPEGCAREVQPPLVALHLPSGGAVAIIGDIIQHPGLTLLQRDADDLHVASCKWPVAATINPCLVAGQAEAVHGAVAVVVTVVVVG